MNNAIVPSSQDEANERLLDWCFATKPQSEDWATVLANPEQLNLVELTKALSALGPESDSESLDSDQTAWRLQQRIRLAVRHSKQLPIATPFKCAKCGTNPTDPILSICLHCADIGRQIASTGSRGNCRYLWPAYNPIDRCWSLLSYRSYIGSDRSPVLLYVATGFADYSAAEEAIIPVSNYVRLIQRSTTDYIDIFDVLSFFEMVSAKLPMSPAEWAVFSRRQILRHYSLHNPRNLEGIFTEAIRKIASQDSSPD